MTMRKIFPILAAAAALMFAATSCNLDFKDNYTFNYEILYELETQEQVDAVEAYFDSFIETHRNYTYFGEYSAAVEQGVEHFIQDVKDLDEAYILEMLETDKNAVRLMLVMSSSKMKTVTAYQTWIGAPADD